DTARGAEDLRVDAQEGLEQGDPDPKSLGEVELEEYGQVPSGFEMPPQEYGAALFELARQIETPARYKHLRNKMGRFEHEGPEGDIELVDVSDVFALAHEVSHAIDYRLSGDKFPSSITARFSGQVPSGITEQALRTELALVAQLMRPVPGNQLPSYRRKHTELMADFYQLYLLDTPMASDIAPNMAEAFERKLASNPKLYDAIQATLAERQGLPEDFDVSPIRPVEQPTTLIPKDLDGGDYKEVAESLVKALSRTHKLMVYQAQKRAFRWEKKLTERELEDVGAAVENIGNLTTGEPAEDVLARLTPTQKKVLREYRISQEQLRQSLNEFVRDIKGDDFIAYVEDYLFHLYVRDRASAKKFASRWARKVPSAQARRFPTLQEAVDAGFVPLTQNVAHLHLKWAQMNWRGALNQRIVQDLTKLLNDEGMPVLMKPSEAPPDWERVDHPAIRRIYAKKTESGALELWHGGAAVDPEVYRVLRQIFEAPFTGKIMRTVEYLNAFARKAAVTLTFFHHSTLTGSATGSLARSWNPLRGIVLLERGLKGGIPMGLGFKLTRPHLEGLRLMENDDFVRDIFLHGLQVDPIADAAVGVVNKALQQIEVRARTSPIVKHIPGLAYFPKALRRFLKVYDGLLWNRYHLGLKTFTYWDVVMKEVERMPMDATDRDVRLMKELAAELINDAYGGQEWESKFWLTTKGRQLMYAAVAYPDWTWSNLNIARKAAWKARDPQARRFLWKYWRNMLIGFYGLINGLNYVLNKKMVWENEPGHGLDIDVTPIMRKLPWTKKEDREDPGRRWYVRPGKQFREVLRYASSPVDIIGAKLSPFLQWGFEQFTGHQTGQIGWEMPWARKEMSFYESLPDRALATMEKFVPFSLRGNNFALTFPMSRGMSWYKAQKAYEEIIRSQVDPSVFRITFRNSEEFKKRIDAGAELNGLDAEDLYRQANTMVRTRYYGQLWQAMENKKTDEAERIVKILVQLGVTSRTVKSSGERRGISAETVGEVGSLFPAGRRGSRPPRAPRRPRRKR
ncbi:hypothetical protein LCGC14_1568530, partial [marine sediment metagenome]